jgi:hypothetical protein
MRMAERWDTVNFCWISSDCYVWLSNITNIVALVRNIQELRIRVIAGFSTMLSAHCMCGAALRRIHVDVILKTLVDDR